MNKQSCQININKASICRIYLSRYGRIFLSVYINSFLTDIFCFHRVNKHLILQPLISLYYVIFKHYHIMIHTQSFYLLLHTLAQYFSVHLVTYNTSSLSVSPLFSVFFIMFINCNCFFTDRSQAAGNLRVIIQFDSLKN